MCFLHLSPPNVLIGGPGINGFPTEAFGNDKTLGLIKINMPTYDYKCSQCDNEFEEIQSMKDALLTKCPTCGNETLVRLIGGGGVIFKGSGFYQTDYAKLKESFGYA